MNKEIEDIVSRISYLTPARYLSGRIVEYDIKSANITMLYKYNMISNDYFLYLSNLPKIDREIEVGNLIRKDKKFYDIIQYGIIEAKKKLFELNNLDLSSVVRIANDAVYINSSIDLAFTEFDNIIFKKKSLSSSFLKLDKLLFFFSYNNGDLNIDIKGINPEILKLHQEYMITFIANLIYTIERVNINDALIMITNFYEEYINMKLDIGFYRELNSSSMFKYKYGGFYISNIDTLDNIDINYNLYLLRELWSIVLEKCNIRRNY